MQRTENGIVKGFYPDFLIIRYIEEVGYVIDILEPHRADFADNLSQEVPELEGALGVGGIGEEADGGTAGGVGAGGGSDVAGGHGPERQGMAGVGEVEGPVGKVDAQAGGGGEHEFVGIGENGGVGRIEALEEGAGGLGGLDDAFEILL